MMDQDLEAMRSALASKRKDIEERRRLRLETEIRQGPWRASTIASYAADVRRRRQVFFYQHLEDGE